MRHGFRHGVGQAARTHVVDELDRVVGAERPAGVDHFLCAPLHLRIATLHRGKIEFFAAGAAAHRRGRAAAEPDQHRWPAQHHELRAHGHLALQGMHSAHVAEPAGDHDRLVVAACAPGRVAGQLALESTEIAADAGSAKFVVECGRADRALEHDLERRGDARGRADALLPGLFMPRDAQV